MSARFEWEKRLLDSDLRKAAKFTGLALATYSGRDGGNIYPSQRQVVERTGQARSTVQEAMRDLVETGWLVVTAPAVPGRRGATYQLAVPGVARDVPPPPEQVAREVELPLDEVAREVTPPLPRVARDVAGGGPASRTRVARDVAANRPLNNPVTRPAAVNEVTDFPPPPPPGADALRLESPGAPGFPSWLTSNSTHVLDGDPAPDGYVWGRDDDGRKALKAAIEPTQPPLTRRGSGYAADRYRSTRAPQAPGRPTNLEIE